MSEHIQSQLFPWYKYSKKIVKHIEKPRSAGFFTPEDAEARSMLLTQGYAGDLKHGNQICLYWLVDNEDGIISDVKFQAFGHAILIACAEAACGILLGKNYDQARRIGVQILEKELRDSPEVEAISSDSYSHLNMIIDAIDDAAQACVHIPLPASYVSPPQPLELGEGDGPYPGFEELDKGQKIAVIEQIIQSDIRPYIEMDAGGVEVLDLVNDKEVLIAYSGACTSCFSSIGATLNYIQQVIQNRVHPDLTVVPDMENMEL